MGYKYKEEFIQDTGYKWYRDRVSILVQAMSVGQKLTDAENYQLAKHIDVFLEAISGSAQEAVQPSEAAHIEDVLPINPKEFKSLEGEAFYKYVSDDAWGYLKSGSFQFGTAEYYRNIEGYGQDQKEGYGHFHLKSANQQLNIALRSGHNCVMYCGTGAEDDVTDKTLRQRFGRKRIRIDDVEEFAKRANRCLGSNQFQIIDVAYRKIKNFAQDMPGVDRFCDLVGREKVMSLSTLRKLNKEFFATFYEFGLLAGVFVKPLGYSMERERRIVFELRKDRRAPIVVEDRKLLDFVTFLPD